MAVIKVTPPFWSQSQRQLDRKLEIALLSHIKRRAVGGEALSAGFAVGLAWKTRSRFLETEETSVRPTRASRPTALLHLMGGGGAGFESGDAHFACDAHFVSRHNRFGVDTRALQQRFAAAG